MKTQVTKLIKTDAGIITNYQSDSLKLSFNKYNRDLIEVLADNLNRLGYMVALTLSDFRTSYLLTDPPLQILKESINKVNNQ